MVIVKWRSLVVTKRFEEYVRGTAEEIVAWANENEPKGEFCIVVEGSTEELEPEAEVWWEGMEVNDHVEHYIQQGLSSKEAIKQVAKDRNLPKREVYQAYHIE